MEFIARLGIVVEEAEESVYWLDLILNAQMMDERRVQPLRQEAAELLAIFARSIGTARLNARATKNARSVQKNQMTK
jgi:four helix bundle protein